MRHIYGALDKLNSASNSLRFMYGDLPRDDPLSILLETLKVTGRDIRNRIEDRVDEMAQAWPERQTEKRVIVLDSEDSDDSEYVDEKQDDSIVARDIGKKRRLN